jgi:O-antigen ligase
MLFALVACYPTVLVPALVVLSVFIETTFQPLTISVGGTELMNLNGVVNIVLISVTGFLVATGRIRPFRSLITKVFLLYCVAVAVSLAFSVNPFLTVKSLVRVSAAFCIYLTITQVVTEKRAIDRTFQTLLMASAIPIAVGLYQIVFVNNLEISRNMRVAGTFRNGQSYSMYLGLLLPFVFGQALFSKARPIRRLFFAGLFIAGLVNLVYSSTRIGWGAFVLAMVCYAVLSRMKAFLPAIALVLVLLIIVFFPFFVESFGGFLTTDLGTYLSDDVSHDFRSEDYYSASSLHIRVFVWKHMLREVLGKSALFGLGSGTWFDYYDKATIGFVLASHSDYFEVLFGTGLLGFTAYLLFRLRQLMLLNRFFKSDIRESVKTTVILPCLATQVACLAMSVTEVWQAYDGIYWTSWITFAISEAYYKFYHTRSHYPHTTDDTVVDHDDIQT